MPELTVKEIRIPELHLPELQRDEIVRALSEIRLPEVEMPRLSADPSELTLPRIDLGKAIAGVAATLGVLRPIRRPRWPIAMGIAALLAVVIVAIVRNPAVQERADRAARVARERIDSMRSSASDSPDEIADPMLEAVADATDHAASIADEVPAAVPA